MIIITIMMRMMMMTMMIIHISVEASSSLRWIESEAWMDTWTGILLPKPSSSPSLSSSSSSKLDSVVGEAGSFVGSAVVSSLPPKKNASDVAMTTSRRMM